MPRVSLLGMPGIHLLQDFDSRVDVQFFQDVCCLLVFNFGQRLGRLLGLDALD